MSMKSCEEARLRTSADLCGPHGLNMWPHDLDVFLLQFVTCNVTPCRAKIGSWALERWSSRNRSRNLPPLIGLLSAVHPDQCGGQ